MRRIVFSLTGGRVDRELTSSVTAFDKAGIFVTAFSTLAYPNLARELANFAICSTSAVILILERLRSSCVIYGSAVAAFVIFPEPNARRPLERFASSSPNCGIFNPSNSRIPCAINGSAVAAFEPASPPILESYSLRNLRFAKESSI
jgi:hypothetical protein